MGILVKLLLVAAIAHLLLVTVELLTVHLIVALVVLLLLLLVLIAKPGTGEIVRVELSATSVLILHHLKKII